MLPFYRSSDIDIPCILMDLVNVSLSLLHISQKKRGESKIPNQDPILDPKRRFKENDTCLLNMFKHNNKLITGELRLSILR